MAEYSINFSSNASQVAKQLEGLQREIASTVKLGSNATVKLNLDASALTKGISASFRQLEREIEKAQRKLNRLQIGGGAFRSAAAGIGFREGQVERGRLIAEPLRLRGQAQSFEKGSNVRLQKELQALRIEASQIAPNTPEWVNFQKQIGLVNLELQKADKAAESIQLTQQLGALNPGSLQRLEAQLTVLRNRAREIVPNSDEWRQLNKQIQNTEASIEKINRRPLTMGQRAGAAGGAFLYGGGLGGGIGSAVGGIAGGLAGGVPGAFTGAALGQLADNLGQSLAGITTQASSLVQLQRGLAMASTDAQDFAQAQEAVVGISQRLLMPLEEATRYFTQLRANTREYNMTVADTAKIMEGTALAIAATGGSSEDLSGAMRAVVQIMSKGGVQAEELRGQLGERFPGAVVKFAKANKMSFEELQDALQNGKVGIADFVKFAEQNYEDYEQFSQKLATAPEFAGRRLQIAFEGLTREIGGLFAPMGASLQDALTEAINGIANFIKDNRAYLRQMIKDWQTIVGPIAKVLLDILKLVAQFSVQVGKVFQGIFSSFRQAVGLANIGEARARLDQARAATAGKARPRGNVRGGGGAWRELDQAEAAYRALGGDAAFNAASGPLQPEGLIFGGPGAGMSIDRQGEDEASKQKKTNLEAFERLRDQLADAYNRAEIERIKARYELEKRLREDLFDIQEFGANRLQRQNLQFLRALVAAEQERFGANLEARLNVAQEAGKVDQATSAFAMGKGTASGGAIFGATGRVFNAPGWVHGHFQNQNREALVQDTVEVVMGLIARGVSPELGSGARFSSKMSPRQIEALVRRGVASHKQYASGIGAVDIFVPAGTQVPTPVSGVQNLGGAAGVTGTLPRGTQLMHLDPRSRGLAGAPRKVGSNEARDTMAAANTEIAKGNALLVERNSEQLKNSDINKQLAKYISEVFGLPDLELDLKLLKERNDLMAQGVSDEMIDSQLKLVEIEDRRNSLLELFPEYATKANLTDAQRKKILDQITEAANKATAAEKDLTEERIRGQFEQQMFALSQRMALAGILNPDQELLERLRQENPQFDSGRIDQLFQATKVAQEAETVKQNMQGIAASIGDSFGNAFKGIVTGTSSVRESLADMFQSIANSFADMVARMIAEWAKTQLLQGFQNVFSTALPALGATGANFTPVSSLPSVGSINPVTQFPITGFANGGIVTGPTMGLVGEGRFNEAIVPLPNGKSIPVELGDGAGNQIMTNITVNVNNGQMQSNGNGSPSELGRKLEGAVKQILISELRPGGVLASGRR